MIRVELDERRRGSNNSSKNLASLLFCFLSIVSICLAAFNFYLLAWIWSNIERQLGPVNNHLGVSLLNELNFFNKHGHQSDKIRLSRNLISENSLSVRQIRGNSQDHRDSLESIENDYARAISGSELNALMFSSKDEIRIGGGGDGDRDGNSNATRASLIVSAKHNTLAFPNGFLVRRATGSRSGHEPIVCGASQKWTRGGDHCSANQCRLTSSRFKLTLGQQVNFANKSIQTNRLQTKRLHSPLNKIQLLSTDGIKFESRSKQIHVEALDTITLGSRNSIVIIKANKLDLGKLIELERQSKRPGQSGGTRRASDGYKLCVCLPPELRPIKSESVNGHQTQLDELDKLQGLHPIQNNSMSKRGRIFAVRRNLKCSKFTADYCNASH